MRTRLLLRLIVVGGLVLIAVALIGLVMRPTAAARTLTPLTQPSVVITDTRWLALIQSTAPGLIGPRVANTLPSIYVQLTDGLVAGRVLLASSVRISATRAGSLIASAPTMPFPDGSGGYLYAASFVWYNSDHTDPLILPGDVVWVMQSGTSVSLTVPALTALADAPGDEVYGVAPISQSVTAYLYPFTTPEMVYTQTAQADADGHYRADFAPTLDIRPRDSGYVAYAETSERVIYVRWVAPFLRAQVNGNLISGLAAPRAVVAVTVTSADGTPRLFETNAVCCGTGADGAFNLYVWLNDGERPLQAGEHVIAGSAGQVFSMTLISITAQVDLDAEQVAGQTLPGFPIELRRFNRLLPSCSFCGGLDSQVPVEQAAITSTVSGFYSATLALTRTSYGAAFVTLPDGNQTYALWAVPYLAVRMGRVEWYEHHVSGAIDEPFTPLTLTLQGSSGYNKDLRFLTSASDGFFADYPGFNGIGLPLLLETNDVVTITTARGVQAHVQLPVLTGELDVVSVTVAGIAPPGTLLRLELRDSDQGTRYSTIVTATDQGAYFIDVSTVDLSSVTNGEVFMTMPAGHTVSRILTIKQPNPCLVQVQTIFVNTNEFHLSGGECGSGDGQIRLRDARGQIKASMSLVWDVNAFPNPYALPHELYSGTQPVLISAGDSFELEIYHPRPVEGAVTTAPVPTLTVELDEATNAIYGQALANASLSLGLTHAGLQSQQRLTATANAQGAYSVSLNGQYALSADDVVGLRYQPPARPEFVAYSSLTVLHAYPNRADVWGWLTPYTPYTVALEIPQQNPIWRTGRTTDGSFYGEFYNIGDTLVGDTFVLTTSKFVRRLTVPMLSAQVDWATASVFGRAAPHTWLRVDVATNRSGRPVTTAMITTTASGAYSVSFPALVGVPQLFGRLTNFDADGDQTHLDLEATPSALWQVTLDGAYLSGRAPLNNTQITLTLYSGDGVLKSMFTAPAIPQYSGWFTTTIQSGDRLVLSAGDITDSFTVPLLTAQHDYGQRVLTGWTVANQLVEVALARPYQPNLKRYTQSDAAGHYGLDISDLSLILREPVNVTMLDQVGNTTTRHIFITGYQQLLPLIWRK